MGLSKVNIGIGWGLRKESKSNQHPKTVGRIFPQKCLKLPFFWTKFPIRDAKFETKFPKLPSCEWPVSIIKPVGRICEISDSNPIRANVENAEGPSQALTPEKQGSEEISRSENVENADNAENAKR